MFVKANFFNFWKIQFKTITLWFDRCELNSELKSNSFRILPYKCRIKISNKAYIVLKLFTYMYIYSNLIEWGNTAKI